MLLRSSIIKRWLFVQHFFCFFFLSALFLLLLLWFSYFLIKRKLSISSLFLGLLFVTRPNGLFLSLLFYPIILKTWQDNQITLKRAILAVLLSVFPFAFWMIYCYLQTGTPFIWELVQSGWERQAFPFVSNLRMIVSFWNLPFHSFHASKIDVITILFTLFLLVKSKKVLRWELWCISLIFCLIPLLIKDTLSYTRYQTVSFPLFLYLAQVLSKKMFIVLCIIFSLGLGVTALYFVNWYWIG